MMRKIKTKITLIIIMTILMVSAILGFMSVEVTRKATEKAIISILSETVSVAASSAQNTMASYLYTVGEIATAPVLSDPNASLAEKKAVLDAKVKTYYMRSAGLADLGGKDLFTGEHVGGETFFQAALEGNAYMSTPYISDEKQDMYLIISAPVRNGDTVTAVLYFVCDANILSEIINNISIGETGDAYIGQGW
jgi:methyl-accepting chemotaxis protein